MKLTTKSQIELRRLELLLIANKKMRIYSSASIAANPLSGLPSSRQFEDVLLDIENILLSDQTPFCKLFAIADLVGPEIIYNIDVPEVEMSEWSKAQLQTM